MFIILFLLILGMGVGYLFRLRGHSINTARGTSATIAFLILFFGIGIGSNETIIKHLRQIGLPALIISLLGIAGSLLAAYGYELIFKKKGSEK